MQVKPIGLKTSYIYLCPGLNMLTVIIFLLDLSTFQ